MPGKCCVPGCKSNYKSSKERGYVSVFKFPADEELRKRWLKCIPRGDWKPTDKSVVCIKHFDERDVSKVDVYKDSDGNCKEFPRQRPLLLPEAVPKIFPRLPHNLSKVQPAQRCDPEMRRKRARQEEDEKNEAWLKEDIIANFENLCAKYSEKLNIIGEWDVKITDNKILFYVIDCSGDIPKVKVSFQINDRLTSSVCVDGFILSCDELSWVLPSSLRITRWSQIENILSRYVCYENCTPSFASNLCELENMVAMKRWQLMGGAVPHFKDDDCLPVKREPVDDTEDNDCEDKEFEFIAVKQECLEENDVNVSQDDEKEDNTYMQIEQTAPSPTPSAGLQSCSSSCSSQSAENPTAKAKLSEDIFLQLQDAIDALRALKNKGQEPDEVDSFTKSIAAQMRKLPEEYNIDLMGGIQSLVAEKRTCFLAKSKNNNTVQDSL